MAAKRRLRVLITSGPTREPIDPVRFLSNYSTGFMGSQLAEQALRLQAKVTVVSGPAEAPLPAGVKVIAVETAQEMAQALYARAPQADIVIMAAAVADYRPVRVAAYKLRRAGRLTLQLEATPDIIAGMPRTRGQVVVGFALESQGALAGGLRKQHRKRLDLVLVQDAAAGASPFGRNRLRAWLLEAEAAVCDLGWITKRRAARVLLDKSTALWYRQNGHLSPQN
jgi:phosphopantothenoylcysteine decarboxylase/phosphopantothenate--cysteine ligase